MAILHNHPTDGIGKAFSNSICKQLSEAGIEYKFENADRTHLFDTLRALRIVIFKEKKNSIFVNVSVGSKIRAIASMMACMMFKDDVNIRPYYAIPEKYETTPREQETVGLKGILLCLNTRSKYPKLILLNDK